MSALLDELLAGYVFRPAQMPALPDTAAKAANPANVETACGSPADSAVCEGLRIPAKRAADSQTFARVRKPANTAQSQQPCGFSQLSQDSQGWAGTNAYAAAGNWTDADAARYLDRRARLMRWGWTEHEAEALAARLVQRDHEQDDRRLCVECAHLVGAGASRRCGNWRAAGAAVQASDAAIGQDFALLLQRCPGFLNVSQQQNGEPT